MCLNCCISFHYECLNYDYIIIVIWLGQLPVLGQHYKYHIKYQNENYCFMVVVVERVRASVAMLRLCTCS